MSHLELGMFEGASVELATMLQKASLLRAWAGAWIASPTTTMGSWFVRGMSS